MNCLTDSFSLRVVPLSSFRVFGYGSTCSAISSDFLQLEFREASGVADSVFYLPRAQYQSTNQLNVMLIFWTFPLIY